MTKQLGEKNVSTLSQQTQYVSRHHVLVWRHMYTYLHFKLESDRV